MLTWQGTTVTTKRDDSRLNLLTWQCQEGRWADVEMTHTLWARLHWHVDKMIMRKHLINRADQNLILIKSDWINFQSWFKKSGLFVIHDQFPLNRIQWRPWWWQSWGQQPWQKLMAALFNLFIIQSRLGNLGFNRRSSNFKLLDSTLIFVTLQ